jgi:transposase
VSRNDLEVHVILDNVNTHKTPLIRRWLVTHPRYRLHFTHTSASWLNLVERFFALLTEKQVRRGAHRSAAELERAILAYLDVHNENPRPFIWTKSADQILAGVARFCRRTLDSAHEWLIYPASEARSGPGRSRMDRSRTRTAGLPMYTPLASAS